MGSNRMIGTAQLMEVAVKGMPAQGSTLPEHPAQLFRVDPPVRSAWRPREAFGYVIVATPNVLSAQDFHPTHVFAAHGDGTIACGPIHGRDDPTVAEELLSEMGYDVVR